MLQTGGYKVDVADNGNEALEKFTDDPGRYDLIFMDIQMPGMDGFDTTRAIRKAEAEMETRQDVDHHIPIVAITANIMKEAQDECLKAGMDDFVAKPIRREIVFEMVKKCVLRPSVQNDEPKAFFIREKQ